MAEDRGTPLLLVNPDTYQVQRQIEQLEPLLTKDDSAALELLTSLVRENVDLAALGF
jgi:BioD-like phosphotransacetylase family protein